EFDYDALWLAWIDLRSTVFFDANQDLRMSAESFNQIKTEAQWEFTRGRQMTAERLQQALATDTRWQQTLKQAFSRVTFMDMPACQVFPFPAQWDWPKTIAGHNMDTYHRWMENMLPASMGGLPTLAVPAGDAATDQGSGLQFMAAPGQDL